MNITSSRHRFGFTIVELLVVIVVIGILAAITIVSYTGISSRATVSSLQSDLTNALTQLKLDQVTNSMFPSSLSAANGGKGIPSSSGTSYTYAYSNTTTPQTFCITATKNNTSYNITGDGNPQPGICPVLNLDAGNISSYPGTGTTWTDLSGNGNSGTLNGGVTYSAVNGGVLSFDGSTGYVDAGNGASLSFGTGDFSLEAWIYYTGSTTINNTITVFSKTASAASTPGYLMGFTTYGGSSANLKLLSSITNGAWGTGSLEQGSYFPSNTWQYISLVRSGTTLTHYRNASIDGQIVNAGVGANVNNSISQTVGTGGALRYKGYIGKLGIYNKALSINDITQNFNALRGRYGI